MALGSGKLARCSSSSGFRDEWRGRKRALPAGDSWLAVLLLAAAVLFDFSAGSEGSPEDGGGDDCCRDGGDVDVSFIVVGRNDAHSGDFASRLRNSIDSIVRFEWSDYEVNAEVVVVCWNEQSSIPLHSAVQSYQHRFHQRSTPVRFIEVPPSLHESFANPAQLNVLQYHGKNVGIRRACGRLLAITNADVVMSISLMHTILRFAKREEDLEGSFLLAWRMDMGFPWKGQDEGMPYSDTEFHNADGEAGPIFLMSEARPEECLRTSYDDLMSETGNFVKIPNVGDFLLTTRGDAFASMGYAQHTNPGGMDGEYLCRLTRKHRLRPFYLSWPCVVLHQPHPIIHNFSFAASPWIRMCDAHATGSRDKDVDESVTASWGLRGFMLNEIVMVEGQLLRRTCGGGRSAPPPDFERCLGADVLAHMGAAEVEAWLSCGGAKYVQGVLVSDLHSMSVEEMRELLQVSSRGAEQIRSLLGRIFAA